MHIYKIAFPNQHINLELGNRNALGQMEEAESRVSQVLHRLMICLPVFESELKNKEIKGKRLFSN